MSVEARTWIHLDNFFKERNLGPEEKARRRHLKGLAAAMHKRVRNDWDAVFAVTGDEGVGKSVLMDCFGHLVDSKYDIRQSFIFSPSKNAIYNQVKDLHQYGFVNLDEAIKALYKLDWNTKAQKIINKVYSINRSQNKITGLCIPDFTDLNKFFRKRRVFIRIHVYDRGQAAVFIRPRVLQSEDPWFLAQHEKLRKAKYQDLKLLDNAEFEEYVEKCYGFAYFIRFPDVPAEIMAWMKEQKEKYFGEGLEDESMGELYEERNVLLYVLNKNIGVPQRLLGALIDKERNSIGMAVLKVHVNERIALITNKIIQNIKLNQKFTE